MTISLSFELRYLRQHGLAAYVADTASDARSAVLHWLWEAGVPALALVSLDEIDDALLDVAYQCKTPWYTLMMECPISTLKYANRICSKRNFG